MSFKFNFKKSGDGELKANPSSIETIYESLPSRIHCSSVKEITEWCKPDAFVGVKRERVICDKEKEKEEQVLQYYCVSDEFIRNQVEMRKHCKNICSNNDEEGSNNDEEGSSKVELLSVLKKKTDVESGVYEGGFQLWECAIDMIYFLAHDLPKDYLEDKRVLEVGCGHGLPGIFTLIHCSPRTVHFQDFNEEVLSLVTAPNVILNIFTLDSHMRLPSYRFFSGDWGDVSQFLTIKAERKGEDKYDVIVTTDTIYNMESQKKLCDFIKQVLSPSGTCFVCAKTHYFGVGGSAASFKKILYEERVFDISTLKVLKDGASNIREIFSIRFKKE